MDVSCLGQDRWTDASEILSIMSEFHQPDAQENVTEDVFLWALRALGPDLWHHFPQDSFFRSPFWSFDFHAEQRVKYLLENSNFTISTPQYPGSYSLFHENVTTGDMISMTRSHTDLCRLLDMGANAHLVGLTTT